MNLYDYRRSGELADDRNNSFYALLMAAMRRADSGNAELLRSAFPEVHKELHDRYHAPGALLENERDETVSTD